MQFPNVRTETEFFAFQGGLDLMSPALRMPSGSVIFSQNYEPSIEGGYARVKGYERFDGRPSPSGVTSAVGGTAADEAQDLVLLADVRRALIGSPAGSGPVRGVCYFAGALYALRDNVGATAGALWKSSPTGWTAVPLNEEVTFTNANTNVGDGEILTQGGVSAAVLRVVLETGSLASGVNTGRLIIGARVGGSFAAGAATCTGSGTLTLGGAQSAVALPAGGRYQFDVYNFFGQNTSIRMYGANGVGRPFEFDGTVLVFLNTGAATNSPSHIKAHRKYLYLGQGSSVLNSAIGTPYRWLAPEGASEIAVGDTVTGLIGLPGEALGILCRNASHALTGASPASWSLQTIRSDVGAVAYTAQSMSETFFLDDRGLMSIRAAQEYGNFSDATLSRKIQPVIDRLRTRVVGAYVVRQRGLYVLLMNDGTTLMMGVSRSGAAGLMQGALGFAPSCMFSGEDENGVERIFVGSAAGMVYEMDKGSTFDGGDIEAALKIYYHNSKSPRVRKRYRKVLLEMSAVLNARIGFSAEYSYGDSTVGQVATTSVSAAGRGGSWDGAQWDEIYWDSQDISQPEIALEGTGLNIALSFYSKTRLDFGHTLQGALMHYTARRQQR